MRLISRNSTRATALSRSQPARDPKWNRRLDSSDSPKNRLAVTDFKVELSKLSQTFATAERHRKESEIFDKTMAALAEEQKGFQARYQVALYSAIQAACVTSVHLRQDKDAWTEFCNDPQWKGRKAAPKIAKRRTTLKYLLRWCCGKHRGKDASLYFRAASALMNSGTPVDEIAAALKAAGSLKKAAALSSKASDSTDRPKTKSGGNDDRDKFADDQSDFFDGYANDEFDEDGDDSLKPDRVINQPVMNSTTRSSVRANCLIVEIEPSRLREILSGPTECFDIRIRRSPPDASGWVRVTATASTARQDEP